MSINAVQNLFNDLFKLAYLYNNIFFKLIMKRKGANPNFFKQQAGGGGFGGFGGGDDCVVGGDPPPNRAQ